MLNPDAQALLTHLDSDLDEMVEVAASAITEADHDTAVAALAMALVLLPPSYSMDLAFSAILRLAEQKVAADIADV